MKKISLILLVSMLSTLLSIPSYAATQPHKVKCRTKVIRDGIVRYEKRRYTYNFLVEVISDETGIKYEATRNMRPFITATPYERYSIILHNPMPIRVAVNLTIDGLNSITGKPCKPDEGSKWIIEPYSYVTIRGWQVSGNTARRFYFTTRDDSYAKWRSNSWGEDLSVNCGVIGAAYFWNKKDLEEYYQNNPIYEYTRKPKPFWRRFGCKKELAAPSLEEECRDDKQKAGTGMGERESNPTELVHFKYNRGMYKPTEAVIIYYDFAKKTRPQPFLGMDFAPERPY